MTGSNEIGPSGSKKLEEIAEIENKKGGGGDDVGSLLHAKIATLGELKALLIKYLGQKEGLKFYNQIMTSFAMIMLQQLQSGSSNTQKNSNK